MAGRVSIQPSIGQPTISLAASDSLPNAKRSAQYVCDGTDDQVELLAAVDALAAGQTLRCLPGTYFLTASVTKNPIPNDVTIDATGCKFRNTSGVITWNFRGTNTNNRARNLTIRGGDYGPVDPAVSSGNCTELFAISGGTVEAVRTHGATEADTLGNQGVRLSNCDNMTIRDVRAFRQGTAVATVFIILCSRIRMVDVYGEDQAEVIDCSQCSDLVMQNVIGRDIRQEVLDMGNCREVRIAGLSAINCFAAINLKTETDDTQHLSDIEIADVLCVADHSRCRQQISIASSFDTPDMARISFSNVVIRGSEPLASGILIRGSGGKRATDFTLINATISMTGEGITLGSLDGVSIVGGSVISSDARAISTLGSGLSVRRATIRDLKISAAPPIGTFNTSSAVLLQNAARDCVLEGLHITTSRGGAIGITGVGNKMVNCTCREVSTYGVLVRNATGTLIQGNTFRECNQIAGTNWTLRIDNSTDTEILDNFLTDTQGSPTTRGIQYVSNPSGVRVVGNNFAAGVSNFFSGLVTGELVRNNIGRVTEANGTAVIASGSTSIVVSHGLNRTPALKDIAGTPTNSLGSATKFWISTPTSTQFTINVDTDPGATTATFAWSAEIKP